MGRAIRENGRHGGALGRPVPRVPHHPPPGPPSGPAFPTPSALPLRSTNPPDRLAPRPRDMRVRPNFSFRDAILSNPLGLPSPPRSFRPIASTRASGYSRASSLPPAPPRFLLNPTLFGRCFRCFLKGHRAAACRGPRRCLLCMSSGHPASRDRASLSPRSTEPGSPAGRQ